MILTFHERLLKECRKILDALQKEGLPKGEYKNFEGAINAMSESQQVYDFEITCPTHCSQPVLKILNPNISVEDLEAQGYDLEAFLIIKS